MEDKEQLMQTKEGRVTFTSYDEDAERVHALEHVRGMMSVVRDMLSQMRGVGIIGTEASYISQEAFDSAFKHLTWGIVSHKK